MPAPKKPPQYGKSEPTSKLKQSVKILFVLLVLSAIGWMIANNQRQRPLTCESDHVSLLQFGTCHEDGP
ncbi:MAG TPA: hypothetical protein VFR09_06020 [Alphaproteobacteria bacterium]|nr:hypothetical protein [Alphaproteobacteria bacterium]